MAIYSTMFTATDAELDLFFPGWRLPLPQPRSAAEMASHELQDEPDREWDPGPPVPNALRRSLNDAGGRSMVPPLIRPTGNREEAQYQQYLEEVSPAALRTLPHWACKNLSLYELQTLGEALVGKDSPPARLVDCRREEGFAGAMQGTAVPVLATASETDLRDFAEKWYEIYGEGTPEWLAYLAGNIQVLAKDAAARGASLICFTSMPLDDPPSGMQAPATTKSWWEFWK